MHHDNDPDRDIYDSLEVVLIAVLSVICISLLTLLIIELT